MTEAETEPAPRSAGDAPRSLEALKQALLDAILPHVTFDGWSEASLRAARDELGLTPAEVRLVCPRGAVDLALAFHSGGDTAMLERLDREDLNALRFRDRIAAAIRYRLEATADHKEAVRRAVALFALPPYAADGARAIWSTSDLIWTRLGDTTVDVNWYTKRTTLSAVYSATVLYWLGDTTPGHTATWAFLDRRIDDVMQIEKLKATLRRNPLFRSVFAGPLWALDRVRAPGRRPDPDLPGSRRRP